MNRETKFSAIAVFLISFATYLRTMAPTASFWDCGEFIACSKILGIPHPPGAPVFLLAGKIFSMFPAFDTGLLVNMLSVITSALTILILFFIITRLIEEWRGKAETTEDNVILNASGVIGALTYAFTDTFWFNAVEAEVYAASMFLTALALWLTLKWMDTYREFGSLKYIILIFYIFGIALGVHMLSILVVPSLLILIWFTDRKVLFRFDLWAFLAGLLILGYSAYAIIYIRSGLNPPINENTPATWEALKAYLNREQYGQESLFLSAFDRVAPFWEYQIKKMFIRYFAWNFWGKGLTYGPDGYIQEIWSPNGLYGLPFILGLLGFYYHFKRDWKRWLSILTLFFVTGLLLVIYLNQPDPQPRERDYVYVGSFFAFAIWIGIGVTGLLESVYRILADHPGIKHLAAGGVIALAFVMGPAIEFGTNFHTHDRSGNYVAWDHSYNLLQTCEPNAIIFTNGDNDTFPMWYLQEVEGIRKDVRIINLSLLNTNWYIMQLKHDEPKVPINLTDEQILKQSIVLWEETRPIKMQVPPALIRSYMKEMEGNYDFPDSTVEMQFSVAPTLAGRALRVQDYMILNILFANKWRKPMYFAITVEGRNFVGMNEYMRLDGMAHKILPVKGLKVHPPILKENVINKYQYRNLNNPDVYYNENIVSLLQNYRNGFLQLAVRYYNENMKEETIAVLDTMESVMPGSVIPIPNPDVIEEVGRLYYFCGQADKLESRLDYLTSFEGVPDEKLYNFAAMYNQLLKNYGKSILLLENLAMRNPNDGRFVGMLATVYEQAERYQDAETLLSQWLQTHPDDQGAQTKVQELRQRLLSVPQGGDSLGNQ